MSIKKWTNENKNLIDRALLCPSFHILSEKPIREERKCSSDRYRF